MNAVCVKYLAECKQIPEERETTGLGSVYNAAVNVNALFYTQLSVCNFTLGV